MGQGIKKYPAIDLTNKLATYNSLPIMKLSYNSAFILTNEDLFVTIAHYFLYE